MVWLNCGPYDRGNVRTPSICTQTECGLLPWAVATPQQVRLMPFYSTPSFHHVLIIKIHDCVSQIFSSVSHLNSLLFHLFFSPFLHRTQHGRNVLLRRVRFEATRVARCDSIRRDEAARWSGAEFVSWPAAAEWHTQQKIRQGQLHSPTHTPNLSQSPLWIMRERFSISYFVVDLTHRHSRTHHSLYDWDQHTHANTPPCPLHPGLEDFCRMQHIWPLSLPLHTPLYLWIRIWVMTCREVSHNSYLHTHTHISSVEYVNLFFNFFHR